MNRFWRTASALHRRLGAVDIEYCVIKSYGGNLQYNHGNIDVVVKAPLWEAYRRALSRDYNVSRRDVIKNCVYERNKLMLESKTDEFAKIHLHSNVGWHNLCFVAVERILANTVEMPLDGGSVRVLARDEEARVLVLHIIFERFMKNRWDSQFLKLKDYTTLAEEFGVPENEIVKAIGVDGLMPLRYLWPIWRRYYSIGRSNRRPTVWNLGLHFGFVLIQLYRRHVKQWLGHSSSPMVSGR